MHDEIILQLIRDFHRDFPRKRNSKVRFKFANSGRDVD